MKTWGRGLGLAVGLALAVGSLVRSDDTKVTGDLKKMQGTWVLQAGDNEIPWVFEGDTMKTRFNEDDYVTRVTVNDKASPHPSIDFEILEGAEDAKGKVAKGIYKLEDGKLTVCVALPDTDSRPNEFRGLQNETMLFALSRAKP
jgi:uncharacterized protein (TIGR03067 family)